MRKRKRLNVTRRAGRLWFRRETRRLHDGTPDGETLWIMNSDRKPSRVVFASVFERPLEPRNTICVYIGTYRIVSPIEAAHLARYHLLP